jgi:DNA-binding SARP family transcriptional activator
VPRFNILGELEIVQNGRSITPSPPKVRRVLALLVVRANQVVHPGALIEELWGHRPPKSCLTTLQTYIYHLRKMLAEEGLESSDGPLLVTRLPGYLLRMPRNALDAEVFEQLVEEGSDHLDRNDPDRASAVLREALGLWTGPALANVSLGSALEGHAVRLEEQRMHALQMRIQADLELGRYHGIIGELRALTAAYPLNEWFSSQLINALAGAGRRSDALDVYQKLRCELRNELGLDPSAELQEVLRNVLATEPASRPLAGAGSGQPVRSAARESPRPARPYPPSR